MAVLADAMISSTERNWAARLGHRGDAQYVNKFPVLNPPLFRRNVLYKSKIASSPFDAKGKALITRVPAADSLMVQAQSWSDIKFEALNKLITNIMPRRLDFLSGRLECTPGGGFGYSKNNCDTSL